MKFTVADVLKWIGAAGAVVVAGFVALDPVYQVLLVVIGVDILTGFMRGWQTGTLTSKVAFDGVMRKTGEVLLVGACAYLQQLTPAIQSLPLPEAVATFYIYNEALSVLENLAAIGVPVPDFLAKALAELNPDKSTRAAVAAKADPGPMEHIG